MLHIAPLSSTSRHSKGPFWPPQCNRNPRGTDLGRHRARHSCSYTGVILTESVENAGLHETETNGRSKPDRVVESPLRVRDFFAARYGLGVAGAESTARRVSAHRNAASKRPRSRPNSSRPTATAASSRRASARSEAFNSSAPTTSSAHHWACAWHMNRAPLRVRRWEMPTSLRPSTNTSPGPTPAKQTRWLQRECSRAPRWLVASTPN